MEKSNDTHPTSCNFLDFNKMSKVKKVLDDAKNENNPEIDLVDKGITSFEEMPGLRKYLSYCLIWRFYFKHLLGVVNGCGSTHVLFIVKISS